MIDRDHPQLSISKQCRLLSLNRSGLYHRPRGESWENEWLMRDIDRQFLETPFYGVEQMTRHMQSIGWLVNVKRVRRLMRLMCLAPIYQQPGTSVPAPGHKVHPYLLRGVAVNRPNQAWCADITYIPLAKGFLYLVAVMDWWSRRVLAWRLSNTMDTDFCIAALDDALARFGKPEMFNTDQGSQFTSHEWTGRLGNADIRISMDGKGAWRDNVFVERLWRSVKYECVYLRAFRNGTEARREIGKWVDFYNNKRPHAAHGGKPPGAVYRYALAQQMAPAA